MGENKHTSVEKGSREKHVHGELKFQHITCELELPAFQHMGKMQMF